MNERIERLWLKASSDKSDGSWADQVEFLERFAELIIKETLQVARAGIEFGDGMEAAVHRYFGVK